MYNNWSYNDPSTDQPDLTGTHNYLTKKLVNVYDVIINLY